MPQNRSWGRKKPRAGSAASEISTPVTMTTVMVVYRTTSHEKLKRVVPRSVDRKRRVTPTIHFQLRIRCTKMSTMKATESHSCSGICVRCGAEMTEKLMARIELTRSLVRADEARGTCVDMKKS